MKKILQKISPCLWFDNQAQEAAQFYVSLFKNSKIETIAYYGEEGAKASGMPKGTVMTVAFQLEGQDFLALNGGPIFKFTHDISFMVHCETQEELDYYWEKLSEDGETEPCGWLIDKYGISWQIVPANMEEMIKDPDTKKTERVMHELLKMQKIDIQKLKKAYEGTH